MRPVVILKTGHKIDSLLDVPGDYEDWIREGMHLPLSAVKVVDVAAGDMLPEPQQISAVVITGSAAMVTDGEDWMEQSASWLREIAHAQIPILGICFGHQLLAYALGGQVDYNPNGVEVGTMPVELTAEAVTDPLLGLLPASFPAQLSHSQSVIALPPGATLLARSEMEPHQAFVWGACAWGIQFHPEFNECIIPHFIEHYRPNIEECGGSVDALLDAVEATPRSHSLLERFSLIAGRNNR